MRPPAAFPAVNSQRTNARWKWSLITPLPTKEQKQVRLYCTRVIFVYAMILINFSSFCHFVTEQIYTLVVTRWDVTTVVTDIPDAFPTAVLGPGESVTATGETLELFVCGETAFDVLETKADVLTGPPSSVMVSSVV